MAKDVNINSKPGSDEKQNIEQVCSEIDPFYSDSNIRHLENIVRDIKNGKAHFAEHDLIEVDE